MIPTVTQVDGGHIYEAQPEPKRTARLLSLLRFIGLNLPEVVAEIPTEGPVEEALVPESLV